MTTFFSHVTAIRVVFGVAFGLFAAGCEMDLRDNSAGAKTSSADPVTTVPASDNTASAADSVPTVPASAATPSATDPVTTVPASPPTTSAVLNDDPNCVLVLKYQNHDIHNDGQVHYLNRVLTSDSFGSANPICVQYNDTQTGEVTLWKDPSSTGQRVNVLPSDRVIDKIVVWYK